MVVQRSVTGLFSCTGLIVACLQTVDCRAQDELQILIPVQNQGVPFCCDFSTFYLLHNVCYTNVANLILQFMLDCHL